MATIAPYVSQQFLDGDGNPLAGGLIYTYEAGTSTLLSTFNSSLGDTPNPNPIVLDAEGRAQIFLSDALYKFVINDSNDVTLRTVDGVSASSGGVETADIVDGAVTTPKLALAAVTAPNIASNAVTTEKILDGAVTTLKIGDGAVTPSKMSSANSALSEMAPETIYQPSSVIDVVGLSVQITTSGRPVLICLTSDPSSIAEAQAYRTSQTFASGVLYFTRDTTVVGKYAFGSFGASASMLKLSLPPSSFMHIDTPAAGTFTYKIQLASSSSNIRFYGTKLIAFEL